MTGKISIFIVAIIAAASSIQARSFMEDRARRGRFDGAVVKGTKQKPEKKKDGKLTITMLRHKYAPASVDGNCPKVYDHLDTLMEFGDDPFKCSGKGAGENSCICGTVQFSDTQYKPFSHKCITCSMAAKSLQGQEADFSSLIVGNQLVRSLGDSNGGNNLLIDPQVGIGNYIASAVQLVTSLCDHMADDLKMKFASSFFETASMLMPKIFMQFKKEFKTMGAQHVMLCDSILDSWGHLEQDEIDTYNCFKDGTMTDEDKEAAKKCSNRQGMKHDKMCQGLNINATVLYGMVGLPPPALPAFCLALTMVDDANDGPEMVTASWN